MWVTVENTECKFQLRTNVWRRDYPGEVIAPKLNSASTSNANHPLSEYCLTQDRPNEDDPGRAFEVQIPLPPRLEQQVKVVLSRRERKFPFGIRCMIDGTFSGLGRRHSNRHNAVIGWTP